MENGRIDELNDIASEIRKDIVRMVGVARSGPLEFPLSISELLVYLYWEEMLIVADNPFREDRDRFLLGIEDGAPALYAVLARRGYFKREELWHYRRLGAILPALPDLNRPPGIDAPCITAGTELSIASAIAESVRGSSFPPRIFCLIHVESCSDDDFILEAQRAANIKLSNLILVIILPCRRNATLTGNEHKKSLIKLGWSVCSVEGHNLNEMAKVFGRDNFIEDSPKAVFMSTKNDSILSFIEAERSKAARSITMEEMDQVLEEMEGKSNE